MYSENINCLTIFSSKRHVEVKRGSPVENKRVSGFYQLIVFTKGVLYLEEKYCNETSVRHSAVSEANFECK
jgi:hypothetical protein